MLSAHPLLRCGRTGLVCANHPMGVPRLFSGHQPGWTDEGTERDGGARICRGTDSSILDDGKKIVKIRIVLQANISG